MEFINKCKEGNLEFIKNNYKNYNNYYINKGFIELCKNDHLKIILIFSFLFSFLNFLLPYIN